MSSTDLDVLSQVLEQKASEARSKRQDLVVALEEAQRAEEIWKRLRDAQRHGCSAEVVSIFRKEADVFIQLRDSKDKAVSLLELLYRGSEEKAKNTARRSGTLFPEACKEAGIKLDSSSRHPRYSVREFIQTVIDERKLEARVTPRDASSAIIPLDIRPLVSYLRTEIGRLFETERDHEHFLLGLRKAYRAVLREEKKSLGDELPLRRVTNRLSKNWTRFHYDEFNVDLGNIVRSGEMSVDGTRLHLNHTRDTRKGMLLYGLERSGYIGFISFKPENS